MTGPGIERKHEWPTWCPSWPYMLMPAGDRAVTWLEGRADAPRKAAKALEVHASSVSGGAAGGWRSGGATLEVPLQGHTMRRI